MERLQTISSLVGKDKLVVDVRHVIYFTSRTEGSHDNFSCRRRGDKWFVAMNKWQDITTMEVNKGKGLFIIFRPIGAEFYVQRISTCWHSIASETDSWALCLRRDDLSCRSEFLIHAADVEGLCQGIDEELVKSLRIFRYCHFAADFS